MKLNSSTRSLAFFLVLTGCPAVAAAQVSAPVALTKAALVAEVKNDQREMLAPGAGRKFLWVTAKLSAPPATVDLTKVALVSGPDRFPLIGVDSAFGGDPSQFSMIAVAQAKDGKALDPLEETRSNGSIAFAFSPKTKTASLKVLQPDAVCLLFSVPAAFKTGQIDGLGAKPLPLPALAAGP